MTVRRKIVARIFALIYLPTVIEAFTSNFLQWRKSHGAGCTRLYGGYDSVVGADPNTPIQMYASSNGCQEELSTLMVLHELDLNFQLIEVMDPKPDWFIRVHPAGVTPALRNPADTDDIIYNSFDQEVNQYLCNVYETITKISCPIRSDNGDSKVDLFKEFDTVTKPLCLSYLNNSDPKKDDQLRQDMERSLCIYEESLKDKQGPFLAGDSFSLMDINLLSSFLELNDSKNYQLLESEYPNLSRWLKLCSERPSVNKVTDVVAGIIDHP